MLNCLFVWFIIIRMPSSVLSMFIICFFFFPSLWHHPRLYLSLNISSFHFSSKGMHPRLNLSFFCLHLVSHYWDIILGSFFVHFVSYHWFYLCLLFVYLFSHLWDTILGSIKFLLCYFGFSLLGHHPMFNLSLFFFHSDARHYLCFFPFPLVCHH